MNANENVTLSKILEMYGQQTRTIVHSFGPGYGMVYDNINAPVMTPIGGNTPYLKHDTGVGVANATDLWFGDGGLFADCCIGNPVMSLLVRPTHGVGAIIPVVGDNNEVIKRAYLTGDYDLIGARPEDVCDPSPTSGAIDACFAEFRKGRVSHATRTAELDQLINNACIGINRNRFYFINRNRGVSGPAPAVNRDMTDEIFRSALYREMHVVGTRLNYDLMKQFWTGDPANDTAGGGYKEFVGLLDQIVDDYGGGKAWVTGTGDCAMLNSDVKAFDACIGAANANGDNLYDLLSELQFELTQRARGFGAQVDWVIVMASPLWHEITKALPCEMISDGCSTTVTGVTVTTNDGFQTQLRNQMRQTFTIDIGGATYPVLLDDFIPVVEAGGPAPADFTYTSDIVILPLRVNGEPTIQWVHSDYRTFNEELSGLPIGLTSELRGWTDDGRNHWALQRDLRCFLLDVKAEFGLIFTAPHLAGRVTGVQACTIQTHTIPNLTV